MNYLARLFDIALGAAVGAGVALAWSGDKLLDARAENIRASVLVQAAASTVEACQRALPSSSIIMPSKDELLKKPPREVRGIGGGP